MNARIRRSLLRLRIVAVFPRIRAHDPDDLNICGPQTWTQDVDKASRDPVKFDNVAYTLHFYSSTHKQRLRDKVATALNNGIALMVTEWGASEASGNGYLDVEETRRWWDFLDKHHLSWGMWSVAWRPPRRWRATRFLQRASAAAQLRGFRSGEVGTCAGS